MRHLVLLFVEVFSTIGTKITCISLDKCKTSPSQTNLSPGSEVVLQHLPLEGHAHKEDNEWSNAVCRALFLQPEPLAGSFHPGARTSAVC